MLWATWLRKWPFSLANLQGDCRPLKIRMGDVTTLLTVNSLRSHPSRLANAAEAANFFWSRL